MGDSAKPKGLLGWQCPRESLLPIAIRDKRSRLALASMAPFFEVSQPHWAASGSECNCYGA